MWATDGSAQSVQDARLELSTRGFPACPWRDALAALWPQPRRRAHERERTSCEARPGLLLVRRGRLHRLHCVVCLRTGTVRGPCANPPMTDPCMAPLVFSLPHALIQARALTAKQDSRARGQADGVGPDLARSACL